MKEFIIDSIIDDYLYGLHSKGKVQQSFWKIVGPTVLSILKWLRLENDVVAWNGTFGTVIIGK